jgi:uncharacterized protein (DUF488 family)
MNEARTIWTIGHSNHTAARLIDLLQGQAIGVVADTRTSPYSRYSTQFNKDQLQRTLESSAIKYLFLGTELGGRPTDPRMYDDDGRVRYDLVSATDAYLSAVARLLRGATDYRIALLCGEEDPISCHRRRLVGRTLRERGVSLAHIRGDGAVTTEAELEEREATEFPERFQLTLDGPPPWRSEHPVKRAERAEGDEWTES